MEISRVEDIASDQKLYTLGEFYIKKGNYPLAKEVFSRLTQQARPNSHVFHFLGKIEFELGNMDLAALQLEKARELNPFFKPTLSLLQQIYEQQSMFLEALKCVVDLYLLSKETQDGHADQYRKKIRSLVKKITPSMDIHQKNIVIRERNKFLNRELASLEEFFTANTNPSIPAVESEPPAPTPQTKTFELDTLQFDVNTLDSHLEGQMEDVPATPTPTPAKPIEAPAAKIIPHPFEQTRAQLGDFQHILFHSLSPEFIDKIQKFSSIYTYEKNQTIHQPMDLIYGFTCILDGKVQVFHQDLPLIQLESGSIVDEAELLIGSKYFFETRAIEKTKVVIIDKPALLTLSKSHHELGFHFLWHFYKSLSLKISAVFDNVIYQNPTKDVIWSLDLLQEFSQHRKLTPVEVHVLEKLLPKSQKKKGEILFKNHVATTNLYILLEGEVLLEHPHSGDVAHIHAGEYFSEISLVSNGYEHALNAKVESDKVEYLTLPRADLQNLCNPEIYDHFQFAEMLWKIYSWKYFEFLNFYFHLLKSTS